MVDLETKLKELIVSCSENIDTKLIDKDTDLVRDLGFDSINIVKLVVEIECAFEIEIDEADLLVDKLSNYMNLLHVIEEKCQSMEGE